MSPWVQAQPGQRSDSGDSSAAWEWLDECTVRISFAESDSEVADLQSIAVDLARRLTEIVIRDGVEDEPFAVDADDLQGPYSDVIARLLRVGPTLALVHVEFSSGDTRGKWLITLRRTSART